VTYRIVGRECRDIYILKLFFFWHRHASFCVQPVRYGHRTGVSSSDCRIELLRQRNRYVFQICSRNQAAHAVA
jgi:hypothetical protein